MTVGVVVRVLLAAFGRTTVLDGFYLHAAWRLSIGDRPYLDFVHVAFPVLEALYAPIAALDVPLIAGASMLSGVAVIATSLFLCAFVAARFSAAAGLLAGIAYQTAAPIFAWHAFERELWTNLGLAAALFLMRRREAPSDRQAALVGLALAFAILAKLTAAVGSAAILLELLLIGRARAACIAAAAAALPCAAAALVLHGAYGAEFATQVFVFYFFKGESGSVAMRLQSMLAAADPAQLLGAASLLCIAPRAFGMTRPLVLLFAVWVAHYALVSPSYWDHNSLDLLLPLAALAGVLLARLPRERWLAPIALAAIAAGFGWLRGPTLLSTWHPHGFGGSVAHYVPFETDLLREFSAPRDQVVAPNPLTCALVRRRPFVSDYELEPVARGVLAEIRWRGLEGALRWRREGVLLGVADGLARLETMGNLAQDRTTANARFHVAPRIADAAHHREIAVLIEPLPLKDSAVLSRSGYERLERPPIAAWIRR